jgi:hypothetical protein
MGTMAWGRLSLLKGITASKFLLSMPTPTPKPKTLVTAIELLSRFLRGMALGVLCAGLLLFGVQTGSGSFVTDYQQWLVRLIFLLLVGTLFGVGALAPAHRSLR